MATKTYSRSKMVTIEGEQFSSIKEAVKRLSTVLMGTVRTRLSAGWPLEEALGLRPHAWKGKSPKQNAVVYDGELLPSQKALADKLCITAQALSARLRKRKISLDALTVEQVCSDKRSTQPTRAQAIVFDGETYKSYAQLCRSQSIDPRVFQKRRRAGWTIEQALGREAKPASDRNYLLQKEMIEGKILPKAEHGSYKLYEIRNVKNSKIYIGITVSPLDARWRGHLAATRKGLSAPLYRAIRKYGADSFVISLLRNDAVNFLELQRQEIEEISCRNAIKLGYNVALGGSVGTSQTFQVGGLNFPSWSAAAEHYGVPHSTLSRRIHRDGWSPEQAVGIAPRGGKVRRIEVEIDGTQYRSLQSAAVALHLDHRVVRRRLSLGWTIRQSLGLDDRPLRGQRSAPRNPAQAAARQTRARAKQLKLL